jgi:DnaJ-class molecular chaperone
MNPTCPHPMEDPEGYAHWCEMNACPWCYGTGSVDDDRYDDMEMDCPACQGSGIDPSACDPPGDDDE